MQREVLSEEEEEEETNKQEEAEPDETASTEESPKPVFVYLNSDGSIRNDEAEKEMAYPNLCQIGEIRSLAQESMMETENGSGDHLVESR